MSDDTLIPIEQKEIDFYGDAVIAVRMEDGAIYVPVRPLCKLIGVGWKGQNERINRDTILSEIVRGVRVTRTPDQGGVQTMICLPLDGVHGWLFGINDKRVKPEIRDALLRYKRECYQVLYEAFGRNEQTARPDDELMNAQSPSAEAYRIAHAVAQLARQHYYLEKQIETNTGQIGRLTGKIGRLDERLSLVEANMGSTAALITESQAQQIAEAVKLIGAHISKQSGRNEFGAVYGRLYRQFEVTSYKRLPSARFETAMGWLRDWWVDISGAADVPF